ncbi:MAG: TIGR03984 family CRISPR-associated protein [Anaerolineales bacterium]|nr:TIGR03984 family CRISPR-associated protein [Anaerolineales bacterium]
MARESKPINFSCKTLNSITDPVQALYEKAKDGNYKFLLAFADDGVIWGEIRENQLVLSSDAFPGQSPPLREETLWQARLFAPDRERLIWKDDLGWRGRELIDGSGNDDEVFDGEAFDESFILWGTNVGSQRAVNGFYQAEEADSGTRHFPPQSLTERHSLRLTVRHYLDKDETGAVFIRFNRLVGLENRPSGD